MSEQFPRRLHVEFFGGFSVQPAKCELDSTTQPITHFRSRQAVSLLAFLAFHQGQNFSREELIELLWPDCDPRAGRNRFSVALSSLRAQLETADQPPIFEATRNTLRILPDTISSDVALFETARSAAAKAIIAKNDGAAKTHLSRAVNLYRGHFLAGLYDHWSTPHQARLEEDFFQSLIQLIELEQRDGASAQAIVLAERGASLDPTREDIACRLVTLYLATNQLDAARKRGREIERALRESLNLSPSPKLSGLLQKVNQRLSTPSQPVSVGVANLPVPRTNFFGREQETKFLKQWLVADGAQLLTLTGAGGSGKTRLAIEALRAFENELEAQFPGGVFFVSLGEIHDAQVLPQSLRAALHLAPAPNADALTQVIQALAPRAVLLLLDNFEQLLPEGNSVVEALLKGAPRLKILTTSRRRLNLSGEQEYSVAPLSVAENSDEALDLFCDRAKLARPDFALDNASTPAARRLIARLDGIPLAIELAASRIDVLTPSQILQRLNEPEREAILVSQNQDATPRHRTLSDAIAWSFHLLAPELQTFWLRLAVFRGGSTPDAAQAVCGGKNALSALSILRGDSLITAEEQDGEMRFHLLETLREWAHERISLNEKNDASRAHAEYFTQWATKLSTDLRGPQQAKCFHALETENENLRAALDWCEAHDAILGLRLCVALREFWRARGYYDEGRNRLASLLAMLHDPVEECHLQLSAQARHAQGQLDYHAGDYASAQPNLQWSFETFEKIGDRRGATRAQGLLGWLLVQTGAVENGTAQMQSALATYQELDEWDGLAELLFALSVASGWRDENVRRLNEEFLQKFRERKEGQSIVIVLNALGTSAFFSGQTEAARAYIEESLELAKQLGQVWDITLSLWILGNIARRKNDFTSAREYYEQSLRVMKAAGKWPIPLLLQAFSYLDFAEENFPRAAILLSSSVALWPPTMRAAPLIEEERERHHQLLQQVLTPEDWRQFSDQGAQLGFENAVALALGE